MGWISRNKAYNRLYDNEILLMYICVVEYNITYLISKKLKQENVFNSYPFYPA